MTRLKARRWCLVMAHATMLPGEGHLLTIDLMPDLTTALGRKRR